jgi:D-3-phosphoglycerate dehydrogenase
MDNVLLSPHVGWYSEEAQDEVEQAIATNVARVLAGEDPPGKVDPDQEWLHHTYIEWDR